MSLRIGWTCALLGALVLNNAALADVTVSTSSEPTAAIGTSMSELLGVERNALDSMAPQQFAALATGVEAPKPGKPGAAEPSVIRYDAGWLAAQPAATGDAQWECLAQALYFESRGESVKGQFAVAEVILNRLDSALFPNTVCAVVRQGGRGGCQFSYTCDRASDTIRDRASFAVAGKIARLMLDGAPRALTLGATNFHTLNVRPGWSRQFPRTASIGAHVFYRQPGA